MNILEKIPFLDLYDKTGFCELDYFEEAILVLQNFLHYQKDMVIVKNNLYNATKLYDELKNYLDDSQVSLFGFDESLVVETIASSPELSVQRIETLINMNNKQPKIIITHALGLVRPIIGKEAYFNNVITLKNDDTIDFKELSKKLMESGYNKVSKVTMPNEYAIRGNVIDIYCIAYNMPARIDAFGDTIESIKLFDVASQRSRITIDDFTIYPASIYNYQEDQNILNEINKKTNNQIILDEITVMSEINKDLFFSRYYNLSLNKSSIIAYLNKPIVVYSSLADFKQTLEISLEESYEYLSELALENKAINNYELFLDYNEFQENNLNIDTYRANLQQKSLNLFPVEKFKTTKDFLDTSKDYLKDNYEINLSLTKQHDLKTINSLLKDNNLENKVQITKTKFSRGFISNELKLVVYTEKELFYQNKRKSNFLNKYSNAVDILNLDELKEGDYIVHNHHGIGQYVGLIQLKVDNINKDFLHIIYKNNEKLYIPIDQFHFIKKYSSSDATIPKLSVLGGSDWKKTKLRVQKRIEDMMDELLELYATRQQPIGFSFREDDEMQRDFEDDFEYELTIDQEKAIEDVKKDMESNLVMDRLICGDVGYGKTEVALRAILKAILSNKQAAFLCPTTILSRQHYHTLLERFSDYSISIVQLTRNTTAKMVKQIKEDLKNKKIDIVVGTHKILAKDLEFADLGLLVIDEEQRFGVKDKEKIKQIKESIDVLTLSATPIPRTLQMSLSGLRKMSLLQTPPINRVPIQTYVVEKNRYLIKEAIERELVRNGQVFYLHNKTGDIDEVALKIEQMFADVKVAIIHGKMSKDQVEKVMENFDNNEYNILVCTTIIETGIDIPNANTIIIEDADKFGLAQLYQIKGRVGRSDRVGYAYLMYQKNKNITEEAQKRLQAIKELTKLGSGYKIALRDLAIRGAGDILGKTQAGNIETVGYEMYLEMLQEVIDKRNNVVTENEEIETINLKNTGYIPNDYQLDDNNKINLYKKIYSLKELSEFDDLVNEIRDVYGKLPASVLDIVEKRKFEIIINHKKKLRVLDEERRLTIQLPTNINDKETMKQIFSKIDSYGGLITIEIKYNKLHLSVAKNANYLKTINETLQDIYNLI